MKMARSIKTVAVVGAGVIGGSWAALFLAKGLNVVAMDVMAGAENRLRQFVDLAWPAMTRLGLDPTSDRGRLTFTDNLASALAQADFVQESGPERLDFKHNLYEEMDRLLPADVIIASSSSGLMISEIQSACTRHPERCVLAHPFNPPHLIPLVEIAGGRKTARETVEHATAFYRSLHKITIRLRKEVAGHVANRLQAALLREVVHVVAEGIVSVEDADAAVSFGPGLRWSIMGPTMLAHLGGGEGGIERFLDQFTEPINAWWASLGTPMLTPEIRRKLIDGINDATHSRTVSELAAERDRLLIKLLEIHRDRH
jgi:3-hydroxyacyl-CoA dehydrogenase